MRIAIVEDTDSDARLLQSHLDRYSQLHQQSFTITRFRDGREFLGQYQPVYGLILLDIDLPGINGMEVAQRLRELDSHVLLMFTTNLSQYAVKGYAVNALDYLLKPIDYYSFSMKFQRALAIAQRDCGHFLTVNTKNGLVKLDIRKILYVEVMTHQLLWHTESEVVESRGALKDVEEALIPHQFARCNSGYLVNLRHVTALQDDDVVVGTETLRISRPRKKAFTQALTRYLGGQSACIHFTKNSNS